MVASLDSIWRYPLRGLPGERLEQAVLTAGQALPGDRVLALASGLQDVDGGDLRYLSTLEEAKLALLSVQLDDASGLLTIARDGKRLAQGKALEPLGQTLLTQFFAGYLAGSARGAPRLLAKHDGFHDNDTPLLSLINLASVADIARVARGAVDPRRFRGNLLLQGLPAWAEMAWIGRRLRLGAATLDVVAKTVRCAVTGVNPETGQRDLNVPRLLQGGFGHAVCGVYARVVQGGAIRRGDPLVVLDDGA